MSVVLRLSLEMEMLKLGVARCWLMTILGLIPALSYGVGFFSCTGVYVGKSVSIDGTSLYGRMVDIQPVRIRRASRSMRGINGWPCACRKTRLRVGAISSCVVSSILCIRGGGLSEEINKATVSPAQQDAQKHLHEIDSSYL